MSKFQVRLLPLVELGGTYGYVIECDGDEVERRGGFPTEPERDAASVTAERHYRRRLRAYFGMDEGFHTNVTANDGTAA